LPVVNQNVLNACGFPHVFAHSRDLEIVAVAFAHKPDAFVTALFGLPA